MILNKFRSIVIGAVIITSLLFSGTAYAQDEELPDPGITPDSPFYFFDTLSKNIGLFFAFGPEAKARKALEYAEERLAEANAMALKNRAKEVQRTASDYDKLVALVAKNAEKINQPEISDNISERVALATSKHIAVLDRVREAAPDQAKEAIDRAREASLNGQKNALQALAERNTERAMEINMVAIESRLNRAKVEATDNITEEAEEALEDAGQLLELEDEILEAAQAKGKDITFIEQQIAKSTANRLDVLERVYKKVPEQARPAIENAMANSIKKYDRAIESLEKKNAIGEVTGNVSTLERLRDELKERLELISENVTAQAMVREEVKERIRTTNQEQVSANQTEPERVREESIERLRLQEKVQEAILEAEEELAKIQAKAEEMGVTLSNNALATFDRLLSEAKSAFTAENYEEAERLVEQAEEALEDVEEEIDNLVEEKGKREVSNNGTRSM